MFLPYQSRSTSSNPFETGAIQCPSPNSILFAQFVHGLFQALWFGLISFPSQSTYIIQFRYDTLQIADAIAIRIAETLRINLVDDSVLKPFWCGGGHFLFLFLSFCAIEAHNQVGLISLLLLQRSASCQPGCLFGGGVRFPLRR